MAVSRVGRSKCVTLFCTFLCRQLRDYPWKCLISCFVKDVNKQWQNWFSSWTWIWLLEIKLQKSALAFWQNKRVGIITIETEKKWIPFSMQRFLWLSAIVVSFKNSLIFTQDVTNASMNTCCKLKLVFLKKVAILYQTESILTACMSLVHEPDNPWLKQWPSCTNSRKELRRNADWAQ